MLWTVLAFAAIAFWAMLLTLSGERRRLEQAHAATPDETPPT